MVAKAANGGGGSEGRSIPTVERGTRDDDSSGRCVDWCTRNHQH